MDTKNKCVKCGKVIEKDNSYTYDGNYICEGCFNNGYFICSDCGSVTPVSLSRTVNRGRNDERFVCNSCATAYDVCTNCGDLVDSSAIWANDGYNIICHNCSSEYNICRDCHTIITEDESYYYGDEVYCSSCYDERCQEDLDEYVEEYSYKPEPVFLGTSPDNLYMGVELEVDDGNAYNVAQGVWEASKDVYLKRDGSLDTGFEIVSHPATLSYHKNTLRWDKIMEICRSIGDFVEDNGILYSNSSYKQKQYYYLYDWDDYYAQVKLCPVDGYLIDFEGHMLDCADDFYLMNKYGKVYRYDWTYDMVMPINANAYTYEGTPYVYDEDDAIYFNAEV